MGASRSAPDPKFEENLKAVTEQPEGRGRTTAFFDALTSGSNIMGRSGRATMSGLGASGGTGIPNALSKAATMRFAGDAMKEDKKSEQESTLPTTPKPEVKSETSPFSGLLLQKYNENIRKREKEAYDRSIEGIKNPNQMRKEVDQGLISTLPKPLQMMVRGV